MSYFKYSVYHAKDRKKNKGKTIVWFLILGILGGLGYFLYGKFDQIAFIFKKDKYTEVEIQVQALEDELARPQNLNQSLGEESQKKLLKLETSLKKVIENNTADAMLHWQLTRLRYYQYLPLLRENTHLYNDLLFHLYVKKYRFFDELKKPLWQELVLDLRKAIALKLPEEHENKAKLMLANVYIWGELSYWQSAFELLAEVDETEKENSHDSETKMAVYHNKITLQNLLRIIIDSSLPNWELLSQNFSEELLNQWKAIYYLRNGNTPMAFTFISRNVELPTQEKPKPENIASNLKENSLTHQDTPENSPEKNKEQKTPVINPWQHINNAYYLLADLMEKQRDRRKKLYYFSRMNLEEFIPRQKWFLSEFVYLLQFLGEKKKAQEILKKYER